MKKQVVKEGKVYRVNMTFAPIVKDQYKGYEDKEAICGFKFDEIFLISNANEDRQGDIIEVAGWDFTDYNQSVKGEICGVVLIQHKSQELPVGKSFVWIEGNGVYAGVKFADDVEGYDFGKIVSGLVKGNYLKNASVGFIPKKWEETENGYRFIEHSMLEWSIVNIPALPDAQRKELIQKGIDIEGAEKIGLINKKQDSIISENKISKENEQLKEEIQTLKDVNEARKIPLKTYRDFLKQFRELMELPELDDEIKSINQVFGTLKTIAENNLAKNSQDSETRLIIDVDSDSKFNKYFN